MNDTALSIPTDSTADSTARKPGTSNLARTIGPRRHTYAKVEVEGKRPTQHNGDDVAKALLLVPFDDLVRFSVMRFDGKSYDHLNKGHARMCIGNKIRAEAKKGDAQVLEFLTKFAA